MLLESDKMTIIKYAQKYNVSSVYLFGSSLNPDIKSNDIDIGVEGLKPEFFFIFVGELLFALSKLVDVVDLSEDTRFHKIVKKEGVKIYG